MLYFIKIESSNDDDFMNNIICKACQFKIILHWLASLPYQHQLQNNCLEKVQLSYKNKADWI